MEIPKDIETYTFAPGTKEIRGIACRKHKALKSVSLPDGLESIGDAAFSLCSELKKVTIPASVEHIGVAAFCKSGVEEVSFLGVPAFIDNAVFRGCKSLKKILVPAGLKQKMAEALEVDPSIVEELPANTKHVQTDLFGNVIHQPPKQMSLDFGTPQPQNKPVPSSRLTDVNQFGETIVKRIKFTYNNHDFSWTVGDMVSLSDLFFGPITLMGEPAYQFRRKALFVFLRSKTASNLSKEATEYELPANVKLFTRKFNEKYGNRSPRIFLFLSDSLAKPGRKVQVYDEVRFVKANQNTITVKSVLRP